LIEPEHCRSSAAKLSFEKSMAIKTISLSTVGALLEQGNPFDLIDVRTPAEFQQVHARGARSMPLGSFDPAFVASTRDASEGPVWVICKSGGRSATASAQLSAAGLTEVCSVEGGTDAWEKAGLPVDRGVRGTISIERQVRIGAGSLVLVGLILAWTIHPAFAGLSAFVGAGLVFAGISDTCAMGSILGKMPWNR
jgi:rhodanese-related sulfurtransferase